MGIFEFGSFLRDGGLLEVSALPVDTTFRLTARERVPVQITTSAGDVEILPLYLRLCPPRDRGWKYACSSFIVWMQDGVHFSTVADRIELLGGRVTLQGSQWGSVTVFEPGGALAAARQALSWPGVLFAEPAGVICDANAPLPSDCMAPNWLAMPIPVDTAAAVPGDGIVQVRTGDVITVTYQQPNGLLLRDSVVVP